MSALTTDLNVFSFGLLPLAVQCVCDHFLMVTAHTGNKKTIKTNNPNSNAL